MDRSVQPVALRSGYVILLPALFWLTAFALPAAAVFGRAVSEMGSGIFFRLTPYYRGIIGFTLYQALLSTVFSVLLGLPGAFLIGRFRFPLRRFLKSLSTVPFVVPPILVVLGFILVYGNSGFLANLYEKIAVPGAKPLRILYSLKAIIMAHVFYNFPLTLRIVGEAWARISETQYRAALSLGAGRGRIFFTVTLPRLLPALLLSAVLTFLYCFQSFAVVLVLGGNPRLTTVEIEIYRLVRQQLDFGNGSVLAAIQSLLSFSILALIAYGSARLARGTGDEARTIRLRTPVEIKGWGLLPAFVYMVPAVLMISAPLLAVVVNSFLIRATRSGTLQFSLNNWMRLAGAGRAGGSVPLAAVIRTFTFGLFVSALSILSASMAAWTAIRLRWFPRLVQTLAAVPLGISPVILGVGYLLLSNRLPFGRGPRLLMLLLAHTVIAFPFAFQILAIRFRQISPRVIQASRSLGASGWRIFRTIELPLSKRAVITAAVFSLALSAGELNATMILAPTGFTTIPLAIHRLIGSYDISGASALGTILIAVSFLAFLALDKLEDAE